MSGMVRLALKQSNLFLGLIIFLENQSMNTKLLSVIVATILMVSVGMAHATPRESLVQMGGVENGWLVTPAVDGIGGTTALLEQVALSEKASVVPKPIPCPKGKVCPPPPPPPTCCTPGRICVPKLPSCCPKRIGRCPIINPLLR